MKKTTLLNLFLTLFITAIAAAGEPADVAFQSQCDGSTQHYVVILPEGFDASRPADLLITLHGHGSDRWQFVRGDIAEARALRNAAAKHGMILVSPDYRATTSWMGPAAEADMLQILDEVQKKHNVGRTIISGGSMGGSAALTFAALHPDRVDGVIAFNGTANHVEYENFQDAIRASFGGSKTEVPEEYKRRSAELCPERLSMPVAATVGGRDTSVPPGSVRRLMAELRKQGRPALLIDRAETGHTTNYEDALAAAEFVIGKLRGVAGRRSIALPDYCNTPDAMAVLADGSIILSAPNFTDPKSPGVLLKISPNDEVSLYSKLPAHPETGVVCPMGIRQAPSGDFYVADCQLSGRHSRLLRVVVRDGKPVEVKTVAENLDVANGVAIRDGHVYLTDSAIGKADDGATLSAVYRFGLDEENVKMQPGGADPRLVATLKTQSKEIPVGADGIDFDEDGHLYVANCGDATIEKLVYNAEGKLTSQTVLARSPSMKSADGIFYDRATRQIYVADILANAIQVVSLDGKVTTLAQDGDNDGSDGLLDAPSEAVVRGKELIVANFDRVFPGAVNRESEKPYTLSVLQMPQRP